MQSWYDTVPYYVHDTTCKSAMSWNCAHGDVEHCGDRVSGPDLMNRVSLFDAKITRTAVLLGEIMVSHKWC